MSEIIILPPKLDSFRAWKPALFLRHKRAGVAQPIRALYLNGSRPMRVLHSVCRKMKSRRASERRRSSELSDSDTKDLIRLQRTVNVMKGEKRASNAQFFWDEANTDQAKDVP